MYLKYILFIFLNCLISVSDFAQNPPYQGTIFIEKDIINNKDCSAFKNIEYRGRGNKLVYDRRVNNWININAHLFDISWNDSLSTMAVVNPEFTQAQAEEHAMTYGFKTGQLPFCLRTDLKEIWIHEGNNDWGGGNKSILIHTERGLFYDSLGISEETLVHEASHTSLDEYHAKSPSWLDAQNKDNNYISSYARDNPEREDIAESFLLWLAVTYRSERISKVNLEKIIKAIPNRLKYFDNQNFKLNPINCAITSFDVLDDEIYLYPNPTGGILKIKNFNYNNDSDKTSTELYSAEGRLISKIAVIDNEVNLTYLPNGHYFLKFISNGQSRYLPIVKKE